METLRDKPAGLTKDVGYQVGARKTFAIDANKAWDILFSEKGISIWLGKLQPDLIQMDQHFYTPEGIAGKITVYNPYSHIRMKWRSKNWNNNSTLQLRVIPDKTETTISFHQEHLSDSRQREEMKQHWQHILTKLSKVLQ